MTGASPPDPRLTQSTAGSRSSASPAQSSVDGGSASAAAMQPSRAGIADLTGPPTPATPSVPAACLACRGKHLKCDGQTPCSRCTLSNSECVYVASRRGYKGPRRNTGTNNVRYQAAPSPTSPSVAGDAGSMLLGTTSMVGPPPNLAVFDRGGLLPDTQPPSPFSGTPVLANMQLYRSPFVSGSSGPRSIDTNVRSVPGLPEKCFESFYHHFHAGHPFVLPRDQLLRLVERRNTQLDALIAAMRHLGSLYIDAGPARAHYLDEALRLCYQPTTPKDGFLIQALLLLIIALDGSCQQERARELLSDCERVALEINLNTRLFATMHGNGDPVMEESWRRTWWDLYVVDGMIAGVHRVTNFLLFDISADVALPCEEHEYLSGNIPQPMYMEDLDDQLFSGEERPFSSFAYRIAAMRNLGRFTRTPTTNFPGDENVAKVEALLTNWRMHLPESKRHNITRNCQLDEMMFQAHFITAACTIMLHQPLSQLDTSPARAVTSCAPHRQTGFGQSYNAHTQFTLAAAYEISRMITQPVAATRHTHFFTCVVTMSSIVHLSRWASAASAASSTPGVGLVGEEDDLRQQIRLGVGALAALSRVWRAAQTACGQVAGVARDVYAAKKAAQISPAFWVGFTQEQMIGALTADEEIMGEFDGLVGPAQGTAGVKPGP